MCFSALTGSRQSCLQHTSFPHIPDPVSEKQNNKKQNKQKHLSQRFSILSLDATK